MSANDDAVAGMIASQVRGLRVDLHTAREQYERIMVHLAERSAFVTDGRERRAMEIMATVVTMDYELKVLLLQSLDHPQDREVWEKYLALALWATVEELPSSVGKDAAEAGRAYKTALQPLRADQGFMTAMTEVRNHVAAHHHLRRGDHWLAQWHLSKIAEKHNGRTVLRSKFVSHAATALEALKVLGRGLSREYPVLSPPPD